ncbi:MAG: hypothetical protein JSV91_02245 [Phycisphaerales bacterium]|nr:MAG: hypothetical protein JSV91_02245 [Phycisphaerales bacterium]
MPLQTTSGLAAAILLAAAGPVSAQTVTVTIGEDIVDIDWQYATIEDLPGPDGEVSFSEAMIATNNTPGHQTVGFAIPEDQWLLQFLYPGRAVLVTSTGYFFRAFDEVTIDGTTQTAFTGDTNPDGWEVVIYGATLYLNADNCTLIGFDSTAVSINGSNGRVEGNTGFMGIDVYGGSGSLIKDNTGGTIKIDRSNDNVVVGNTVQRVRVWGFNSDQQAANNRIGGPNPEDRNYIIGYGTWNGEGLPGGTTVQLFQTTGTIIENNWIGTTPDGLAQGSLASTVGIGFESGNNNITIRNNRIAGILGHGQGPHHYGELYGWAILIGGAGSGVNIVGNTIGLDANDEPTLGSVWGIDVGNVITNPSTMTDINIGGLLPGEGNAVAGHILNGITIGHDVPQVRISGTAVYENGWLGIDLIPSGYGYGVNANDAFDADTGGNGLQNFPEIDSAVREGGSVRVTGTLHSEPSSDYTIEFFASPACDDSGFGEGRQFLGSTYVTTDADGNATFDVLLPGLVDDGWVMTATATAEPLGATSEFSACIEVTGQSTPGDVNNDGVVDIDDIFAVLNAWGACDACPEDVNGDGLVDIDDIFEVLANWG